MSVPIYLSLSVCTDPREQTNQVAKAALIQEIRLNKACKLLTYISSKVGFFSRLKMGRSDHPQTLRPAFLVDFSGIL